MKHKKINRLETEELIAYFREKLLDYLSLLARESTSDEQKYAYSFVLSAIREIDSRSIDDRLKLISLLSDEHPGVRLHAARRLRPIALDLVLPVYEELATVGGNIAFSAKNALDSIRGEDRFRDGPPPLSP